MDIQNPWTNYDLQMEHLIYIYIYINNLTTFEIVSSDEKNEDR